MKDIPAGQLYKPTPQVRFATQTPLNPASRIKCRYQQIFRNAVYRLCITSVKAELPDYDDRLAVNLNLA